MSAVERVGGGLVEISAVVTIIGAPIAEALIHGLKAACGMAWAPMSSFGVIHVSKACLAAAVPDWARESMGLRNNFVDAAIGVRLRIDHRKLAKNRVDLGDACAIQVVTPRRERYIDSVAAVRGASGGAKSMLARTTGRGHSKTASTQVERGLYRAYFDRPSQWARSNKGNKGNDDNNDNENSMCLYALDRNSKLALDTVIAAERGDALRIHRFMPDVEGIQPAWRDWAVTLASLSKVAESACLRRLGSQHIWYWTACGWLHAFLSAVLLQLLHLGRDNPLRTGSDLAAGILPTPLHLGGQGKVILGVPANVRRHPLWRGLLALGIACNVVGLFGTFLFLGDERPTVIYVWIAFQGLWLAARTVVYHVVEGAAAARQGVVVSKPWEEAPDPDRRRVMTLLSQLTRHQVSIHPRGADAYRHDCLSFDVLHAAFSRASFVLSPTLLSIEVVATRSRTLNVRAAAGDNLIRSAAWFTGANLNNSDIYDACIAFIPRNSAAAAAATAASSSTTLRSARGTKPDALVAVPCVRVFACNCAAVAHHRHGAAGCTGPLEWLYFIPTTTTTTSTTTTTPTAPLPAARGSEATILPCPEQPDTHAGSTTWTFAHGVTGTGVLATETLSDADLDNRLGQGRWTISLRGVGELKAALEVSRDAAAVVVQMLRHVEGRMEEKDEDEVEAEAEAGVEVEAEAEEETKVGVRTEKFALRKGASVRVGEAS